MNGDCLSCGHVEHDELKAGETYALVATTSKRALPIMPWFAPPAYLSKQGLRKTTRQIASLMTKLYVGTSFTVREVRLKDYPSRTTRREKTWYRICVNGPGKMKAGWLNATCFIGTQVRKSDAHSD